MAIRVLFRCHFGLPFRQASEEEKQKVQDGMGEVFKKWKASGTKLMGYFGSSAHVDGFSHYMLFEIDDAAQVGEMDNDIFAGEIGKYVEDFQIHVGRDFEAIEEIWK